MSLLTESPARTSPAPGKADSQIAARIRKVFKVLRVAALWEAFLVALGSLRANKLRTSLTLVGIVVGVTAVIAVVTIIKGLDQTVATTFSSPGSTVFTVSKKPRVITSREDFITFNKRKDVTMDDAEAIFRLCTVCWRTGVAANSVETVKHGDKKSESVAVRGVSPVAMFDIDAVSIDVGRVWSEGEGTAGRELCVVGADIGENLFGGETPDRLIGQSVNVG